eukprot:8978618-Pyramimonas_sp.AAC.1
MGRAPVPPTPPTANAAASRCKRCRFGRGPRRNFKTSNSCVCGYPFMGRATRPSLLNLWPREAWETDKIGSTRADGPSLPCPPQR